VAARGLAVLVWLVAGGRLACFSNASSPCGDHTACGRRPALGLRGCLLALGHVRRGAYHCTLGLDLGLTTGVDVWRWCVLHLSSCFCSWFWLLTYLFYFICLLDLGENLDCLFGLM
jgi:hypothetical protein